MENEKITDNGFEYEVQTTSEIAALTKAVSAAMETMKQKNVRSSEIQTDNWKIVIMQVEAKQ